MSQAVRFEGNVRVQDGRVKRVGTLYVTDDDVYFINVGSVAPRDLQPTLPTRGIATIMFFIGPMIAVWSMFAGQREGISGVRESLDDIEDEEGAMSIEDRYTALPGSFHIPRAKVAACERTFWGSVVLRSDLDDRYVLKLPRPRRDELVELLG